MSNHLRRKVQRAFRMIGPPAEPNETPPVSPPTPPLMPAEPAPPTKSKAALRGERFRARQKAVDSDFTEKERKRKVQERAEQKRNAEIDAVLAKPDKPLTVVNAEGKTVRVISGGYGSRRIAEIDDKSEQAEEENGRRVAPSGAAPTNYDADVEKEKTKKEHDNQFVRASYQRVRTPREVKAMKAFIYSNVEKYNHKSELTICSHCKVEITPFPSYVPSLAFRHFYEKHPKLFETMMAKVQIASKKPVCPIDHEAVKRRFAAESARDGQKLQCGHCHRILWRPGETVRKRSDKQEPELATVKAA